MSTNISNNFYKLDDGTGVIMWVFVTETVID